MFRTLLLLALLSFAASVPAQQGAPAAPGPGTGPAPEAKQFDFLVGEWTLDVEPKVSSLAAMIHGAPKLTGTWRAKRTFDGHGIEDELRIVDASGNPVTYSRAMRIWSAAERRWLVTALDVYRARFTSATATWKDGEMQLSGSGTDREGKPYASRTRFHDITAAGFTMTQDRSGDGGTEWDEAVLVVKATRADAPRGD
jgi:hypothetical protein